jgi:hypothetical protein
MRMESSIVNVATRMWYLLLWYFGLAAGAAGALFLGYEAIAAMRYAAANWSSVSRVFPYVALFILVWSSVPTVLKSFYNGMEAFKRWNFSEAVSWAIFDILVVVAVFAIGEDLKDRSGSTEQSISVDVLYVGAFCVLAAHVITRLDEAYRRHHGSRHNE